MQIYSIKIHINPLCSEVWQHLKILTTEEWKIVDCCINVYVAKEMRLLL
jgi:hypothetical protein